MKINNYLYAAVASLTLMLSNPANAEEVLHFKGETIKSLTHALSIFEEYNNKFEQIIAEELSPSTMHDIHQMTYTMENALGLINKELTEVAENLEAVHQATERADPDTVRNKGKEYLRVSRIIVNAGE